MSENQTRDKFEEGIFWELYLDLERQFENFLEYVPYMEGNENTYSFRLLNLVLSIGGYIDSAFKEMARFPRFSEDEACKNIQKRAREHLGIIASGVDAFDTIYGISTKKVSFKFIPKREEVTPFSRSVPEWWTFYNDLKHEVGFNIKKANLRNTRDALAGAFLLNVVHEPAVLRLHDYHVLRVRYAENEFGKSTRDSGFARDQIRKILFENNQKYAFVVETPVFEYRYEQ